MYQSEKVDSGIQPCIHNVVQHGTFSVFQNILVFHCLSFSTYRAAHKEDDVDRVRTAWPSLLWGTLAHQQSWIMCLTQHTCLSLNQHKGLQFHPGWWSWHCCFLLPYSIPCMILLGCLSLFLGDVCRVVPSFELVWLKLPSPIFPWSNVDVFSSSSGNSIGVGLLNQRVGACLTFPESLSFLEGLCHKVFVREQGWLCWLLLPACIKMLAVMGEGTRVGLVVMGLCNQCPREVIDPSADSRLGIFTPWTLLPAASANLPLRVTPSLLAVLQI